ncbi:MAG: AAA family ATPase [Candidatus Baldrarchaeia archaeon]
MSAGALLEVKDLGPIKSAEIELRRIVVLLGRNNVGKSYLASVIYALGRSFSQKAVLQLLMKLALRISGGGSGVSAFAGDVVETIVKSYEEVVKEEVLRVFTPLDAAVRWGSNNFLIRLDSEPVKVLIRGTREDVEVDIKFSSDIEREILQGCKSIKKIIEAVGTEEGDTETAARTVTSLILSMGNLEQILQKISERFTFKDPIYLLAERAGLFRAYRPLLTSYIKASLPELLSLPRSFKQLIEEISRESFHISRITADMLTELLMEPEMPSKQVGIDEVRDLEQVLEGTVEVTRDLRLIYKREGISLPLDKASSLIAELAPLYLALRKITPGRSLIMEEPEAHVHPKAQVLLAKLFAKVARRNISILITTHSMIFPTVFAHLCSLGKIPDEKLKELGLSREYELRPEDLAIYWMRWDGDGSVTEQVKVTPPSIEKLPEMDEVAEDLYGEEARLITLSHLSSGAGSS